MPGLDHLASNVLVRLGEKTNRTLAVPVLLFAPTSRCNSRCQSCDWWQSDGSGDLSLDEIARVAAELPGLRTKLVVITGGEPLLRPDVMAAVDLFRAQGVTLHLLTSGLALEKHAEAVAARFAEVTLSLDGHTTELYQEVRGVRGLEAVERGIARLRQLAPHLPVRARSTLHRLNFRALPQLIDKARALGLAQISFLSADVSSDSFGRAAQARAGNEALPRGLLLDAAEVAEFTDLVERTLLTHAADFESGRVAERGDRLRRLPRYYAAHLGLGPFPPVRCNAPWASAVVESNGSVRPCFFLPAVGNVRERPLGELLRTAMPAARAGLDVASSPGCQRCVCSLRIGLRSRAW